MSEESISNDPVFETTSFNPAVRHCVAKYGAALDANGGFNAPGARDAAEAEYKRALPHLVSRRSTLDFIACIAHGMVFGIFFHQEGSRLITAAKAALVALPLEPRQSADRRPPGRPAKTDTVN